MNATFNLKRFFLLEQYKKQETAALALEYRHCAGHLSSLHDV